MKIAVAATAIVLTAATFTRAASAQGVDPANLPEGEGKALLFRLCTECHDLSQVTTRRRSFSQWKDLAADMAARGPKADDADVRTLIEYCATEIGYVNVNRATESELTKYGGFTTAEAAAIAAARMDGRSFASLADLKAVPGVDSKSVDARQHKIAFKDR